MTTMLSELYSLQKVTSVTESAEETRIGFSDGFSAVLRKADTAYPWMLGQLRRSLNGRALVGVWMDPTGKICDVASADRNIILGMQGDRTSTDEVSIWFGGMDGPLSLLKTHPKFHVLYGGLVIAAAGKQMVWYLMKGGCVLDLLIASPEEDAYLCQLLSKT